jgi:hypothetical protein
MALFNDRYHGPVSVPQKVAGSQVATETHDACSKDTNRASHRLIFDTGPIERFDELNAPRNGGSLSRFARCVLAATADPVTLHAVESN